MKGIGEFGLAHLDNLPVGQGTEKTVKMVDRCSYGLQEDIQSDYELEKAFAKGCDQKIGCQLKLDLTKVFSPWCQNELSKRLDGDLRYGPPKVIAMAVCGQNDLDVPLIG